MSSTLGIRREDKNRWERRVPLTPQHVLELHRNHGIDTIIQPSQIRVFPDTDYHSAGARVQESLTPSSVVFAVKEIPLPVFEHGKTYVFFSHTIKGQSYNMPMLKIMMEKHCTLIDYERIVDQTGKRLVFFGRFAGLAGMVDTLWAFGKRLQWEQVDSPLKEVHLAHQYQNLDDIKTHLAAIGRTIQTTGLPTSLTPLIIGIAGYGHVSVGTQEILDMLPVQAIQPADIPQISAHPSNRVIYKVVFREEHMVQPNSADTPFNLQQYYQHPELYYSVFEQYIPSLSILMNCIFWNNQYPRLVTKDYLKKIMPRKPQPHLKVIGDISVDIKGAIECTEKITTPDNPVFVYSPATDSIHDGYTGDGVVIMAVDNLPCELPRESSQAFSEVLVRYIPEIMNADYSVPEFESLAVPDEIKNAVILYRGTLTPQYQYINRFL
ncbi:MAG: hypothetical protein JXA00_05025 [Candidatus Thermoplasmatota archaeon]|nr:hypothetical protein [Candidatus Thermoplasmatota archaeon]